jgi:hypothetical protein
MGRDISSYKVDGETFYSPILIKVAKSAVKGKMLGPLAHNRGELLV